jgi:hypothetical protein
MGRPWPGEIVHQLRGDYVPISRIRYFINPVNGNQQAVVLYSDGSTVIWDSNGTKRASTGGDRFDIYCQQILNNGYIDDESPDWEAPPAP